jgi:hypothetical protein
MRSQSGQPDFPSAHETATVVEWSANSSDLGGDRAVSNEVGLGEVGPC